MQMVRGLVPTLRKDPDGLAFAIATPKSNPSACKSTQERDSERLWLLNNPYTKGIYGPFIDRQTALKKGLTQYFPGTACPKDHVSPRLTSGGSCIVCHQELMSKKLANGYFREYEAKRRETDPNWRANKARVARESYQRHKDDEGAKEKRKAWYKNYNE